MSTFKERGDNLFRNRDYAAAISEYNFAIESAMGAAGAGEDPQLHVMHSNRCACYLHLGQFQRAHDDATVCVALKVPSTQHSSITPDSTVG